MSRYSRVLDGAALTTAAVIIQGIGQILLLAVLARHISQAEFGLVTATLVVIGLGRQFTEALIRPVIVQREHLSVQDIGTASLISWFFAFVAFASLFLSASSIGNLFSEPDIVPVIKALSFIFLIQAPSLVAEGLLHRELKFSSIAFSEVTSFLLGYTLVGVSLALEGFGVWALVWAYLAQVGIKCIVIVRQKPKTLITRFDYCSFRHIMRMSGGFSIAKLLGYIATQVDYLVVAGTMNSAAVGIYGRAYQLVGMPAMLFGQVLERIMFPIYSRLQNNRQKAKVHYGHVVALSAIVMAPMSVLFVVLGPEIVRVILGPDWSGAVIPLQILACTIMFRMGYKLNDSLTKASGLVYQRVLRLAIYACAVAGGAFVGVPWGLPGIAVGVSFAIVLNFFLMTQLTLGWLGATWGWFASKHIRAGVFVLCFFPLLQGTASILRFFETGYLGVLFGVLAMFCIAVSVIAIVRPAIIFGSDLRWFVSLVARRIKPKSNGELPSSSRNKGIIVELSGLAPEEQRNLLQIVVNKLNSYDIPASDILKPLSQKKSLIIYYISCLHLVFQAVKRAPRVTLYEMLMIIGSENEVQNNVLVSVVSLLAFGELVSKAQVTPGVHLLVSEPVQQLSMRFNPELFLDMTESEGEIISLAHDVAGVLMSNWRARNVEV
ncbi:lipopolysaccharide biosynthesis protein [Moritella sp. 24]|uniref:lipopolysaccharide biosynthesis protein n=1 Tax=Moritella sp. 24 TaxID=2746230 RepID=UPI001BA9EFE7|nr:lipopolysaccharide biosynthesis protein [Moritella sp. 24]